MKLDYKNVKKVGVVAKIAPELPKNLRILSEILKRYGAEILLEAKTAQAVGESGLDALNLAKKCDFLISLGGDGTIISLCRHCAEISPFVLGVHAGRLGFLTDITMDECEGFFAEFFKGNFNVERPFMLDVKLCKKNGEIIEKVAFNDAVVLSAKVGSAVRVEAFLNDRYFNSYLGDGVIVSTPVGSTAYNMSAGGAIISPLSEVFAVAPVCSHSLTQRPIVLSREHEVKFSSQNDALLVIDGQERYKMANLNYVAVSLSRKSARLIRHVGRDYFQILKEKLHWGYND